MSLWIWLDKKVQTVYNLYKLTREVNTMLFGKFCIGFGSTQVYTTKHCAEPFRRVDWYGERAKADIDCLWFLCPFIQLTIDNRLFRPQTMFCLWPFVMPILGQICRGRTVLCAFFFWKGNWYDWRTKSIDRERTKEIGCFCVPAAFGKYPAIILQRSGYAGSRTNCRWYGTCSHQ